MNTAVTDAKQFIDEYFKSLSGQPKTEKLLDQYVSDPGLKEHIRVVEAAFPEYELVPDQLVAEADVVAVRGTFRGEHKGEFAGVQPTGKTVSADLMIFYRISEGRIAEYWLQMDMAGLIQQLSK
ncbi:MAG TPA: ester cyclase [Acidobacteriaceae bacterium]|nr:ester cyclase [Acidobacteriaceae bacterium]